MITPVALNGNGEVPEPEIILEDFLEDSDCDNLDVLSKTDLQNPRVYAPDISKPKIKREQFYNQPEVLLNTI
ncbi:hypothetical protein HUJ05_002006 [Dendroctonus ponderosae]|nr:hypothetical protein HUJ05_002006 [Dendroctonus ponderosae]